MRRLGILLFIISLRFITISQVLSLKFIDKKSGESIPNVSFSLQKWAKNPSQPLDSAYALHSNNNGQSQLAITLLLNDFLMIKAKHFLYEDFVQGFKIKDLKDTVKIEIFLTPSGIQTIKEVIIKAPGIPDTVYGSDRLSVADFEIQKNGEIILLTYPKQLKKGGEIVLFDGGKELTNFPVLEDVPEKLLKDFRGNTHVVCENGIYTLIVKYNELNISTIDKEYFLKYIAPIVDTNRTKLFLNNFNPIYPAFDYFTFDKIDSTYRKLMHIEDDLMMELYKSEYKWMDVRTKLWAKNKEIETGIEAEVWVGANYFTQSIYYEEAYAPLFHRNDSLFVFDYSKDRIMIFSVLGNLIDTVPIYHHYNPRKIGWKKILIQDKVTGAIYALFELNGISYLGMIDVKTGNIGNKVRLNFKYVDKIRVHNNFVYYIYRPFESVQKKYLYREQLPYKIGANNVFQEN
jgi:hypothetical protein